MRRESAQQGPQRGDKQVPEPLEWFPGGEASCWDILPSLRLGLLGRFFGGSSDDLPRPLSSSTLFGPFVSSTYSQVPPNFGHHLFAHMSRPFLWVDLSLSSD